jgi:protein ImuB
MFACLFAPDFVVQAALWTKSEDVREKLRNTPIAILDGPANLPRVFAVNGAACRAGIGPGITKLQAQTYPNLRLWERSAQEESQAQSALVQCAESFSPRVESHSPGTVLLDLLGTEKLFGFSRNIAGKITDRARVVGFKVRVAIASNLDSALYAARGFAGITVIPAGEEAQCLALLPVEVLPATQEVLEILQSWGIQTFHALANLAAVPLTERLGQAGLELRKLARGEVQRALHPVEAAADFVESFEFDDPIETLESLAFVLNRLVQQLCARLMERALATNELQLILELEVRQLQTGQPQERYEHTWKLPFPVQDGKLLLRLISLDLESRALSAPVKKVVVQVFPVRPQLAQGSLFSPPSPEAQQLEITLARIRGLVGSQDEAGLECVGSPRVEDSHRRDSFTLQPFSSSIKNSVTLDATPLAAFRKFRPSRETSVELSGERPHLVSFGKKYLRVLSASGPWCGAGHWWSSTSRWSRFEWDVVLRTPDGPGCYRIYFDELSRRWFVDGIFD